MVQVGVDLNPFFSRKEQTLKNVRIESQLGRNPKDKKLSFFRLVLLSEAQSIEYTCQATPPPKKKQQQNL
jgi:hypothetical protein